MLRVALMFMLCLGISVPLMQAETLFDAAKEGDLAFIREALDADPKLLNSRDGWKYTALHWACIRGHWDTARYLIDRGAEINAIGGDGGTPLNWAAHHDDVDIVAYMKQKGAKLNVQNQWGMTELHTDIWRGNSKVAAWLLDNGADPMIRTHEGWTAMHYACRSGHDAVIAMLKERGLSFEVKDNQDRLPRHLYFKKPMAIKLPVKELDTYTGKYYIGDFLMLDIWRDGFQLKVMEFGPDEIYPVAKDFFYFKQAPWTLIFSRDKAGNISHAQLSFIRRSYTIHKK